MGVKISNGNDVAPSDVGQWREGMGYSVEESSQLLGVSPAEFIRWENKSAPTPRYIALACAALALGIKA